MTSNRKTLSILPKVSGRATLQDLTVLLCTVMLLRCTAKVTDDRRYIAFSSVFIMLNNILGTFTSLSHGKPANFVSRESKCFPRRGRQKDCRGNKLSVNVN